MSSIMADRKRERFVQHDFQAEPSKYLQTRIEEIEQQEGLKGTDVKALFVGIAAIEVGRYGVDVAISLHDGSCAVDYSIHRLDHRVWEDGPRLPDNYCSYITFYILEELYDYREKHRVKYLGAGIHGFIADKCMCPDLCSKLWMRLDIVPLVFWCNEPSICASKIAISMAHKCISCYGPDNQPRLEIGGRNNVEADHYGHAFLGGFSDYKGTVGDKTWQCIETAVRLLRERRARIAFFSSTPRGGGVALMRHSLVRFFFTQGVQCNWYVPKPRAEIFRITKTNHNILQGVAHPEERLSENQQQVLSEWIEENARLYWTSPGGPLASPSDGGADLVVIDNPQMPGLIPIAKRLDAHRTVIFRSHIQIRSDLVAEEGSPAADVWKFLWRSIQEADAFITHPVREFIPDQVPTSMVGYMPATTDWLDGLNKDMDDWDIQYYLHNFRVECLKSKAPELQYPKRDYIIQISRFDPAKGIPDVIESYAKLRRDFFKVGADDRTVPQLVITGVSSIDDPDGAIVYDETMELLEKDYSDISQDVCVMRVGPIDQLLNALLSKAKIALQLSTREGFEVKVSEAAHKGIPVIATKTGGIPLQVRENRTGFLVEPGDTEGVAKHMHALLTNPHLYNRISSCAKKGVSDEVSTVGNALCWAYLACRATQQEGIEPPLGRWIIEMARDEMGEPYVLDEVKDMLSRSESLVLEGGLDTYVMHRGVVLQDHMGEEHLDYDYGSEGGPSDVIVYDSSNGDDAEIMMLPVRRRR